MLSPPSNSLDAPPEVPGGVAETALRDHIAALEERNVNLAQECTRLREYLDEVQCQLLLVVAQRDALHAAAEDAKATGVSLETAELKRLLGVQEKETATAKSELQASERQRAALVVQLEHLRRDYRTLEDDLQRARASATSPDIPSCEVESRHKANLMMKDFAAKQKVFEAMEDKLATVQAENLELKHALEECHKKMVGQQKMLDGYHAVYQKNAEAEAQHQKVAEKRVKFERSRVEDLQRSLEELREENVRILSADLRRLHMEPIATQHSPQDKAVVRSYQIEIARLTAKLKEKKALIHDLKALLQQHLRQASPPQSGGNSAFFPIQKSQLSSHKRTVSPPRAISAADGPAPQTMEML